MNPDKLAPGERCASTSNRNFEGRQGKGGRTHLVSPAVAAATAIAGHFATPDDLETLMEPVRVIIGTRRAARPHRRRHRPDHPERLAEARRAHRLRRGPVLRVARELRLRAQPGALRRRARSSSPARTSAPARRASTRCGRCMDYGFQAVHLAPLRRHLPQQLPEDRARRRSTVPPTVVDAHHARRSRTTRRSRSSSTSSDQRVAAPGDRPRRAVRARRLHAATACSKASTTSASPSATPPRSTPSKPNAPPTPPESWPRPQQHEHASKLRRLVRVSCDAANSRAT